MKKLIISLFALTNLASLGFAGPVESGGQTEQTQTAYAPSQEWYRDNEWNVDLFGAYAFSSTSYRDDRYLNADHAWGGGLAGEYFFHRYFGVGLEGYALGADDVLGQFSGNLVLRLPIGSSPVAPYTYAGGGVIFNGTRADRRDFDGGFEVFRNNADPEGAAQFGGGVEVRFTPRLGLLNDFSWNVINGDHNNFGMVRSGIRFAF